MTTPDPELRARCSKFAKDFRGYLNDDLEPADTNELMHRMMNIIAAERAAEARACAELMQVNYPSATSAVGSSIIAEAQVQICKEACESRAAQWEGKP